MHTLSHATIRRRNYSQLYHACKNGDLTTMVNLFENNKLSVNRRYYKTHTLLHIAVRRNYLEIVEYLLQIPTINVNLQSYCGYTALHYSINPIPFSDEDKKCAELRESFFSNLQTNGVIPRTIILGSRYPILLDKSRFDNKEGGIENGGQWVWDVKANSDIEYKNKISANLLNSIRLILESGRKVILIYPMPEAGWDVPARLAKIYKSNGEIRAEDASTSYIRFIERNKDAYIALDSLGDHKNLIRIKPEKLLCNTYVENRCVTHINGTPLYFDNNHLSNAGAQIINDEIIKFIH
jgi:hypothetical protein